MLNHSCVRVRLACLKHFDLLTVGWVEYFGLKASTLHSESVN